MYPNERKKVSHPIFLVCFAFVTFCSSQFEFVVAEVTANDRYLGIAEVITNDRYLWTWTRVM